MTARATVALGTVATAAKTAAAMTATITVTSRERWRTMSSPQTSAATTV